jgi:hypothetical protein
MSKLEIKLRLLRAGKTMKDVIAELGARGIKTDSASFSRAFRDDVEHRQPKEILIREETEKILTEWESAVGA